MGVNSIVESAIETADPRLFCECYNVWATTIVFGKVPVLVSPHLACYTESNFSFIGYERNALTSSDLSERLVESGGSLMVSLGSDWFNYHCANILTGRSFTFDQSAYSIETSLFFSFVFVIKVTEWVPKLREGSDWPVKSWGVVIVLLWISTAEGSEGVSVEVLLESEHAETLIIALVRH